MLFSVRNAKGHDSCGAGVELMNRDPRLPNACFRIPFREALHSSFFHSSYRHGCSPWQKAPCLLWDSWMAVSTTIQSVRLLRQAQFIEFFPQPTWMPFSLFSSVLN